MSLIITTASAIILGVWGMWGARLMWRVERRPDPIPVEQEIPYERTDNSLDKLATAHMRGVIYVIDALRTIDFWAFSRIGAVVVFVLSVALLAIGGLVLVTVLAGR